MKALLATGGPVGWTEPLGDRAWALLPVGGRPLLETWLECCSLWGIEEVRILLGRHAFEIEEFCGDGTRWGLKIEYSFFQSHRPFLQFLQRDPSLWEEGVVVFHGPVHLELDDLPDPPRVDGSYLGKQIEIHRGRDVVRTWIDQQMIPGQPIPRLTERPLESLADYFEINRLSVRGEVKSPVNPGYAQIENEGAVGNQVVLAPSCQLEPPVIIGNQTRIGAFAEIGPEAILGDGVIVGRGSRIAKSLVLDRSYIGDGLDLENRIVAGNRLVDPEDGSWIPLDDLLLGDLDSRKSLGAVIDEVIGRFVAVLLLVLLGPFHLLGRLFHRFEKTDVYDLNGESYPSSEFQARGDRLSLFERFSLDRVPALLDVIRGKLHLAGHLPLHTSRHEDLHKDSGGGRPAAFGIHDSEDPVQLGFDVHFARHQLGPLFVLRTIRHWIWARLCGKRP